MFIYFWDRERAWVGEGQRERETQNLKQAPGSELQHRARRGARTHRLWDLDLSWSRKLNRLSHPGAPRAYIFKTYLPDSSLSFAFSPSWLWTWTGKGILSTELSCKSSSSCVASCEGFLICLLTEAGIPSLFCWHPRLESSRPTASGQGLKDLYYLSAFRAQKCVICI